MIGETKQRFVSISGYLWSMECNNLFWRPSWTWSYGSWIYNQLCNQCLSPLTLWFQTSLRRGVLDTVCDKVCQWLVTGRWFSPANKIDRHDKTVIYCWKPHKSNKIRSIRIFMCFFIQIHFVQQHSFTKRAHTFGGNTKPWWNI